MIETDAPGAGSLAPMDQDSTDYYLTLAHAVAELDPSTLKTRRIVYDRARQLMIEHARRVDPPWGLIDIVREQRAIEEAIHEVEVEYSLLEAAQARFPRRPHASPPRAPGRDLAELPPRRYRRQPIPRWVWLAAAAAVLLAVLALAAVFVVRSGALTGGEVSDAGFSLAMQPEVRAQAARESRDRGDEAARARDYDKAIAEYSQAIRLDPDNAAVFNNRAFAYWSKGETDLVIADYGAAIRLDPDNVIALVNRAFAYNFKGDYGRAIVDLDKAIKLKPGDARAWNGRCWGRALAGQLQEALADCNESLRLLPYEANTYDSRGLIYFKLGQFDRAIADYDAALRLDPKLAGALYGRGVAKLKKGDKAGSDADIAAAKAIRPDVADLFERHGVR
jgi:tetratricopeptide (TPR) repeat protein